MTLTDDLGRRLTLAAPARRIVSLTPVTTENLFTIGAGAAVVGVTTACDFPAAATKLTRVGDFMRPRYEGIVALRPDLIVLDSGTVKAADIDALAVRVKAPVFVQKSERCDDVVRHLGQLGQLTGATRGAEKAAAVLRSAFQEAARRAAGKRPPSVFVEISASPLFAAGPGSFVEDLVHKAGGINVVKSGGAFPQLSKEQLFTLNPEHYVIALAPGAPTLGFTPPLDRLIAVQKHQIHKIPADLLFRTTPRLADGLRLLSRALHPG